MSSELSATAPESVPKTAPKFNIKRLTLTPDVSKISSRAKETSTADIKALLKKGEMMLAAAAAPAAPVKKPTTLIRTDAKLVERTTGLVTKTGAGFSSVDEATRFLERTISEKKAVESKCSKPLTDADRLALSGAERKVSEATRLLKLAETKAAKDTKDAEYAARQAAKDAEYAARQAAKNAEYAARQAAKDAEYAEKKAAKARATEDDWRRKVVPVSSICPHGARCLKAAECKGFHLEGIQWRSNEDIQSYAKKLSPCSGACLHSAGTPRNCRLLHSQTLLVGAGFTLPTEDDFVIYESKKREATAAHKARQAEYEARQAEYEARHASKATRVGGGASAAASTSATVTAADAWGDVS
jgi:hypothetical protein